MSMGFDVERSINNMEQISRGVTNCRDSDHLFALKIFKSFQRSKYIFIAKPILGFAGKGLK